MSTNLYGRFEVKREWKESGRSLWQQTDLALQASKLVNEYTLRNATDYGRDGGAYLSREEAEGLDYATKLYFARQCTFAKEDGWDTEKYDLLKNPYCCEGDIAKLGVEDKKKNFIEIFHQNDNLDQKFWPVVLKYSSMPWKAIQWKWGVDELARKDGHDKLADKLKEAGLDNKKQTITMMQAFEDNVISYAQLVSYSSNFLKESSDGNWLVRLCDNAFEAEEHIKYSAESWIDWDNLVGAYLMVYKNENEDAVPYTLDHLQSLSVEDIDELIRDVDNSIEREIEMHSTDTPTMRAVSKGFEALISANAELFGKGALKRFQNIIANGDDDEDPEWYDPEYLDELKQQKFELELVRTLFFRIREEPYSEGWKDVDSRYIFSIE